MAFSLRARRVYEEPSDDDGQRILVDRLWPRGLSKERAALDAWLKDIAPSTDLRLWYRHDPEKYAEFARLYADELDDAEHAPSLSELKERMRKGPVTLLTASRAVDISEATVLVDVLSKRSSP